MTTAQLANTVDAHELGHGFSLNTITVAIEANASGLNIQHAFTSADNIEELQLSLRNESDKAVSLQSIRFTAQLDAPSSTQDWKCMRGSLTMSFTPVQRIAPPAESPVSLAIKSDDSYLMIAPSTFTRCESKIAVHADGKLEVVFYADGRLLEAGEVFDVDKLLFASSTDQFKPFEDYAAATRKHIGKPLKQVKRVRAWATWDAYHEDFNQDDIVKEMQWLREHQVTCPADIIQIDGGWCTEGAWDTYFADKLPEGLSGVLAQINEYGFKPGLWLSPFLVEPQAPMYLAHQDWILRKPDNGDPVTYSGRYVWDGSIPEVCQWIESVFRHLSEELQIKYFKLDFLSNGLSGVPGANAAMTSVERYRNFIAAIRRGAGDDAYILGCNSTVYDAEFFDAARMGPDIQSKWNWDFGIPHSANCISHKFYLSGHLYNGDTDYLIVRNSDDEPDVVSYPATATVNEAKVWCDFVTLISKASFMSDRMYLLPPERVALLERALTFEVDQTIALDFWQGSETDNPSFYLSRSGDDVYVGLFNWTDHDNNFNLQFEKAVALDGDGIVSEAATQHAIQMPARSSFLVKVTGEQNFDAIRQRIQVNRQIFPARLAELGCSYEPHGQAHCIDLSEHCNMSAIFKRDIQRGIFENKLISWDDLIEQREMLGVAVSIPQNQDRHMIGLEAHSRAGFPELVEGISVNKVLHSLYFIHANCFGSSGHRLSYIIHFKNDRIEVPIVSEQDAGNWEIGYSLPWTDDKHARIAWIHQGRRHGCYMYEWNNPRPEDEIVSIDIQLIAPADDHPKSQINKPMVIGITGYAD